MLHLFNESGTGLPGLSWNKGCKSLSFDRTIGSYDSKLGFIMIMVTVLAVGCPFRLSLQREQKVVQLKEVQSLLMVVEQ